MSASFVAVQWNRQKRLYDLVLAGGIGLFLGSFIIATEIRFPFITEEILLMRAFGVAAFVLLHVVLCIGPLCRLSPAFLPLLYNRRHAGVALCLLAVIHAVLVVATYHAGSNTQAFLSIFVSDPATSVGNIPFQPLGFVALVILILMAATSHDFWLATLGAPVWKALHMLVYVAYALLVLHVAFGVLQAENSRVYTAAVAVGLVAVIGLHGAAAWKERPLDRDPSQAADDAFVDIGSVSEIPENRARVVCLSGERIAVFKYGGKISAVSNLCQHQNGPLGEGRILDGCITCPWHGYQYRPDTGASPPPFVEKVATFNVRVTNGRILVDPKPNAPGVRAEPALVEPVPRGQLQPHE